MAGVGEMLEEGFDGLQVAEGHAVRREYLDGHGDMPLLRAEDQGGEGERLAVIGAGDAGEKPIGRVPRAEGEDTLDEAVGQRGDGWGMGSRGKVRLSDEVYPSLAQGEEENGR
jgi:hypothetical protein